MHNEKLIRELYHGNIQPNAKMIVNGSEYQKAQFMFSETIDKLEKSLNEQEKVLLEQLTDSFNTLNCIGSEENFVDGFKTGARIMLEIFEKDDEQFRPIIG